MSESIFEELGEEAGRKGGENEEEGLEVQPFEVDVFEGSGLSCMRIGSASGSSGISGSLGSATGLPLTPQASTGSNIVFRDCMGSFGHIRFALRTTVS
jgi:hypothetical protein